MQLVWQKGNAGNNIDGAKVTYRVVQNVSFPWIPWWHWRGGYNPWQRESMEITNGVTQTDSNGRFKIEFNATGDKSIPFDKKPQFNYTIYADVVDITGETHSSQTTLRIGTVALSVSVPLPSDASINSFDSLEIQTNNLSGVFEPATGSLKIELLKSPNQTYVNRYWQKPDNQIINKTVFEQEFPHFAYSDEDKFQNWPVEKLIHAIDFDTEKSKKIDLSYVNFEAGKYLLTITTEDQFGTPIEVKRYLDLYDLNNKKPSNNDLVWHKIMRSALQPNEEAEVYFGTSKKSLPILFEIERKEKIESRKWLTVKDLTKEIIKIQESDRGGFNYHFSYAQHNRSFSQAQPISVAWLNKHLKIEYGTFRDKLEPGQDEEWVIKIKGPKGEKVAAEMVAGMYDASLDIFAGNSWSMDLFPKNSIKRRLRGYGYQTSRAAFYQRNWQVPRGGDYRNYQNLNWFNFQFHDQLVYARSSSTLTDRLFNAAPAATPESEEYEIAFDAETYEEKIVRKSESRQKRSLSRDGDFAGNQGQGSGRSQNKSQDLNLNENIDLSNIKVRTNLNETVFFFPNLMTDEEGNVLIKFKMNEALTKWKFLGLAHTKDLKLGGTQKEIVTQKELMVMPNPPRFFRENDKIEFPAKVVNLSDKPMKGQIHFSLKSPLNENEVVGTDHPTHWYNFTLEAGESKSFSYPFKVPNVSDVPLIEHTVMAYSDNFSDGEKAVTPVLSNRMLVTETKPLPIRGNETKTFTFESLKNKNSNTLKHHALTLEFTQNPAWYAVQALPYLMEYPYECTEQIFSRFYANSLATSVANSHPKVKSVFERWRDYEPDALQSNLSKNQELKSALLEETPWVMAAQSEELQKKNIGLLFDLNRMSYEQDIALAKLAERQLANGGWPWFTGGRDSWYITQYVVEGMGHLDKLGVKSITNDGKVWRMVQNAVRYCDQEMVEQYDKLAYRVQKGETTFEKRPFDEYGNSLFVCEKFLFGRPIGSRNYWK